VITRRRISARDRASLFEREKGVCHLCGGLVHAGEAWDVSHEIPLACGGADDETNWKVAHRKCHKVHTAKVDAPMIAKVRRQHQTHIGASTPAGLIQSRGFAKIERKPKRLSVEKQMTLPTEFQRRMREDA